MYPGVEHFRYFLEGRDFTIYTDHKPLTFSILSELTTDIRHIKGKDNVVADTLSSHILAIPLAVE